MEVYNNGCNNMANFNGTYYPMAQQPQAVSPFFMESNGPNLPYFLYPQPPPLLEPGLSPIMLHCPSFPCPMCSMCISFGPQPFLASGQDQEMSSQILQQEIPEIPQQMMEVIPQLEFPQQETLQLNPYRWQPPQVFIPQQTIPQQWQQALHHQAIPNPQYNGSFEWQAHSLTEEIPGQITVESVKKIVDRSGKAYRKGNVVMATVVSSAKNKVEAGSSDKPKKKRWVEPGFGNLTPKNHCQLCRSNREPSSVYLTHVLRDKDGKVACPVLRRLVCTLCGETGDTAHTIKYCPLNIDVPLRLRSSNFERTRAIIAKPIIAKRIAMCKAGPPPPRLISVEAWTQTNLETLPEDTNIATENAPTVASENEAATPLSALEEAPATRKVAIVAPNNKPPAAAQQRRPKAPPKKARKTRPPEYRKVRNAAGYFITQKY